MREGFIINRNKTIELREWAQEKVGWTNQDTGGIAEQTNFTFESTKIWNWGDIWAAIKKLTDFEKDRWPQR